MSKHLIARTVADPLLLLETFLFPILVKEHKEGIAADLMAAFDGVRRGKVLYSFQVLGYNPTEISNL